MGIFSKKQDIQVSVCIPVYNTERKLLRCLESAASQRLDGLELVVVDDCSPGTDDTGHTCGQLVKQFRRTTHVPVTYVRHSSNKGVLEARRTAVLESHGRSIAMLDSDDMFLDGALSALYRRADETGADIVQGGMEVWCGDEPDDVLCLRAARIQQTANRMYDGVLDGDQIFKGFLVESNQIGFVTGKLISRELYLQAFSQIPPLYCVMADDLLLYFFISYYAARYASVPCAVIRYDITEGISSASAITDLHRWEQVCSASGVFTVLYSWLKDMQQAGGSPVLTQQERAALDCQCRSYLLNNLQQLQKYVVPELQDQAHELLCSYWGADFVQKVEQAAAAL